MESINKILVPIDFSENAKNGLRYAIQIAKKAHAELFIMNAYHIPAAITEGAMIAYTPLYEEVEKDVEESLKKLETTMPELEEVKHETEAVSGYLVDTLKEIVKKESVDLIIMGTRGVNDSLNRFLGSNASHVIQKVDCPVLIIPEEATYEDIENIVFAADYETSDENKMDILKSFANLYDAEIKLLHVSDDVLVNTAEEAAEAIKLDRIFTYQKHSYHHIVEDDVVEGVEQFISNEDVQIVAMMPRKHNLFEKIFESSTTKKMALHTKAPLLVFHE